MPPYSPHTVDNSRQEVLIVFGVFIAVLLISKFILIQLLKVNNHSENQNNKLSLYALALLNGNVKHALRTLFVKLLKFRSAASRYLLHTARSWSLVPTKKSQNISGNP